MFTRTIVNAEVTYNLIAKVDGKVETTQEVATLDKCATKEKAELLLSKQHKGAIVDIISVDFAKITYGIEECDFYAHAKVIKTAEDSADQCQDVPAFE